MPISCPPKEDSVTRTRSWHHWYLGYLGHRGPGGPSFLVGLLALAILGTGGPAQAVPVHQTPDLVLGQVRKDVRRTNSADLGSFTGPFAAAIDPVHKHLYISDSTNGRVLAWKDATRFKNGAPADLAIGQKDGYATERF